MQPDMNQLARMAEQMQKNLQKTQQELSNAKFEGQAGGGAVKVTCSGDFEFSYVKIKPEAVDTSDLGMLEDLVLTAVKEAVNKAKESAASKMASIAGMMPPGMGF